MHRIILERSIGRALSSSEFVDHINGNGLDNRRSNLRIATNTQNIRNSKISKRNTSGYKGVFYRKSTQRWVAAIVVNRRSIHLGYFDDPHEAHLAYCKAAQEYYGEFARFE